MSIIAAALKESFTLDELLENKRNRRAHFNPKF